MEIKIEVYKCLCSLEIFEINGIAADSDDFVDQYDQSPELADEDGGCGYMTCDDKESTPEILSKYGITEAEFREIRERVSDLLRFGECGWCI